MPIDYTRIEEGDTLNAASLNDRLSALVTAINDLETTDLAPGALDSQHLPSLAFTVVFTSGFSVVTPNLDVERGGISASGPTGARDEYENALRPSVSLQEFAPGGTASPYGPLATATTPNNYGWRIVAYAAGTAGASTHAAEIPLASATSLASANITGVLVRGGVGIYNVGSAIGEGASNDEKGIALAIGWKDGLGNRHVVERSIRFYDEYHFIDTIECQTLLLDTDLAAGDGTVATIFMVIANARRGADATTAWRGLEADFYQFSVEPLRAGLVT